MKNFNVTTSTTPIIERPRNAWTRAIEALALGEAGDAYSAERVLDTIKYNPDLSEEAFDVYKRVLESTKQTIDDAPLFNLPVDYLSHQDSRLRKPFRRIRPTSKFPNPYPFGLAMPGLIGSRNDFGYLRDAATVLAEDIKHRVKHVHVVLTPTKQTNIAEILQSLSDQSFEGTVTVDIFATGTEAPADLPKNVTVQMIDATVTAARGMQRLAEISEKCDLLLFLTGRVALDRNVLDRAAFLARISDNILQPLVPLNPNQPLDTPFSRGKNKKLFQSRYPFRDIQGLNLAITPAQLNRLGALNPRLESSFFAAMELAFRVFKEGGYFAPLRVPALEHFNDSKAHPDDQDTYFNLCPNHWDRKENKRFEIPRVSVYIPAYNPAKYIRKAIDSVLEQDVEDLEICIGDDGSIDGTPELLEKHYGSNDKVRWVSNPNGGIGFASNQAIRMARGLYIGQLDSDDCLKPGAVRHLMEYLDDHPETACVYASCERIDAAGDYVKDEYAWPTFSREKMMITSIAHHFRMFRKSAWERTTHFREDIVNAVDYDIFLKLCETGEFHHIEETYYQRRWHGENTSNVNEGFQTTNGHRVQRETLKRLDLDRFWDIDIPNPKEPRRVSYKRREGRQITLFWPDYSKANPYQYALYGKASENTEIVSGPIESALRLIETGHEPRSITFHLHWLNFLLRDATDLEDARAKMTVFLEKVEKFVWKGGRLVWTIHNTVSHDTPYTDIEIEMSERLAKAAHALHFHSETSVDEVAEAFKFPKEKVVISRHGNYLNAYPDYISREDARMHLGIDQDDEVILFSGQVRPYKGVETLVSVFRRLLKERPKARLLIVGEIRFDLLAAISPALSPAEQERITTTDRFVDDNEMQLFFRAADMAVYPYQKILTSGSLLLALSFGVPSIIPEVGMTRETLQGRDAGIIYDGNGGEPALEAALREMLSRLDKGTLDEMRRNALQVATENDWPDFGPLLNWDAT